jgi:DNA-binding protein Fis
MSKREVKASPGFKERIEVLCREMIDKGILYSEATNCFEKCFIAEVMSRNNGNLIRTSAVLGIHRNTLSQKVARHKITKR